jgi:oligoendopeptidase F
MLAAGGSRSPEQLAAMIGLDVSTADHWNAGLDLLEQQLDEAEQLAAV